MALTCRDERPWLSPDNEGTLDARSMIAKRVKGSQVTIEAASITNIDLQASVE